MCTTGKLVVGQEERELYNKLYNYFNRLDGELDINKGICTFGKTGVGKTFPFEVWRTLIPNLYDRFRIYKCFNIAESYIKKGGDAFLQLEGETYGDCMRRDPSFIYQGFDLKRPNVVLLDDLGAEVKNRKYMGNDLNVMEHVILLRNELFIKGKVKTHFTSNLEDDIAFIEAYGTRVHSRLAEMCNMVSAKGFDKRFLNIQH